MKVLNALTITFIGALSIGCTSSVTTTKSATAEPSALIANTAQPLKVVTWNVEHLAYPLNTGCKPRTLSDIEAMKAYANSLNADIFALQEVASKEALKQIFPQSEWQLIVSNRAASPAYTCRKTGALSTQQKVAFAVKKAFLY